MLFNSWAYLFFLPLVFGVYWALLSDSTKKQNILLLIASYVFYGWWDYRFLVLIALSTVVDFIVGQKLDEEKNPARRKFSLWISLVFNLGILGFFKYFDFFIQEWMDAWLSIGIDMNVSSMNIILPVGISFYTFQTLSYTIDIYRRELKPTNNLLNFSVYVAFFPQLVAGPIERAKNLLPQFSKRRVFSEEQAKAGVNLILWGLVKKIVIADNCAKFADIIFENYETMNSTMLILGAIFFAFQIYGDFSGYSDIAIGTARLFGFNLMQNFNYPYFSRNIGEFWRRWHISLSTWFRDYLYIPLGGSRGDNKQKIRNVFIISLVSGFWHGANWTFLIWGGLHAFFFIPLLLRRQNRTYLDDSKALPSLVEFCKIISTFLVVCFAWIFFRAPDLPVALHYIRRLFSNLQFRLENLPVDRTKEELFIILIGFFLVEWIHKTKEHPFHRKFKMLKIIISILAILLLGYFSEQQEFIYFQF